MIIRRKLFGELEKYLASKQAIVVTGMRRVGKTTLLRYFFEKIESKNKIFLDLEDPLNREVFEKRNYEAVKTAFERRGVDFSQKAYIFLDEIQFTPSLPSVVKYLYDHNDIKFFLTGSASFYLKNLFSESLAGRKYLFELYPLDFEEFLKFKGVRFKLPKFEEKIDPNTHALFSPLVEEYLLWGGMPEVVLLISPEEKKKALRDIFSSYFQKEVQTLGDFRKNEVVRNLIILLSKRIGQKIDIQRLSQELGVARVTIYEYLDFLAGTYFISLLPAFGGKDVVVRKQRKIYFIDTGFFSILSIPPSGAVFENSVYQNLRTWGEVFYYQKGSQEIDFVAKREGDMLFALETKETATFSDLRKLGRIAQRLKIKRYFLVSHDFANTNQTKYLFNLQ